MNLPLRKPKIEDISALSGLFTDPRTRQFLGGPCDESRARSSALALVSEGRDYPAWVIILPESLKVVGFVSLSPHHDGKDIEISYILSPEAQGLGLGRAAVASALIEAWNIGLTKIVAETQSANIRSIHLLKSLGFTEQCVLTRFGSEQTLFYITCPLERQ